MQIHDSARRIRTRNLQSITRALSHHPTVLVYNLNPSTKLLNHLLLSSVDNCLILDIGWIPLVTVFSLELQELTVETSSILLGFQYWPNIDRFIISINTYWWLLQPIYIYISLLLLFILQLTIYRLSTCHVMKIIFIVWFVYKVL